MWLINLYCNSLQLCSQHRCQPSTVCRPFQGEDSAVHTVARSLLSSHCGTSMRKWFHVEHTSSTMALQKETEFKMKKEIQTFKFTELSMSTVLLQFNASQWGILIINDVDHNVYAEIDVFFNWIIIIFPPLLYFSCQLKVLCASQPLENCYFTTPTSFKTFYLHSRSFIFSQQEVEFESTD